MKDIAGSIPSWKKKKKKALCANFWLLAMECYSVGRKHNGKRFHLQEISYLLSNDVCDKLKERKQKKKLSNCEFNLCEIPFFGGRGIFSSFLLCHSYI